MRSRYTAYTLKKIAYIQDTMTGPSLMQFNPIEISHWLDHVTWEGLTIISTEKGEDTDEEGIVEFQAFYKENDDTLNILERSEFHKINGRWFYVKGEHF